MFFKMTEETVQKRVVQAGFIAVATFQSSLPLLAEHRARARDWVILCLTTSLQKRRLGFVPLCRDYCGRAAIVTLSLFWNYPCRLLTHL